MAIFKFGQVDLPKCVPKWRIKGPSSTGFGHLKFGQVDLPKCVPKRRIKGSSKCKDLDRSIIIDRIVAEYPRFFYGIIYRVLIFLFVSSHVNLSFDETKIQN